jgi:hypothetical protein
MGGVASRGARGEQSLREGAGGQVCQDASLRSLAISLLRMDGQASIAAANRHHARDPQRTLKLLQTA